MEKAFSIRESIKSAWKLIGNDNLFLLIGLILGYLVIYGVLYIPFIFHVRYLMLISIVLLPIFQVCFVLGFIKVNLQISQDEEPTFRAFLPKLNEGVRFVLASVVNSLPMMVCSLFVTFLSNIYVESMLHVPVEQVMLFIPLFLTKQNILSVFIPVLVFNLLFLIPVIYIQLRWIFFPFYIMDKNAGIVDSLRQSWNATEGHFWHLVVLSLTFIGLVILGFIALVLGVFVAIPLISMVLVLVYLKLDKAKNQSREVIDTTQI